MFVEAAVGAIVATAASGIGALGIVPAKFWTCALGFARASTAASGAEALEIGRPTGDPSRDIGTCQGWCIFLAIECALVAQVLCTGSNSR